MMGNTTKKAKNEKQTPKSAAAKAPAAEPEKILSQTAAEAEGPAATGPTEETGGLVSSETPITPDLPVSPKAEEPAGQEAALDEAIPDETPLLESEIKTGFPLTWLAVVDASKGLNLREGPGKGFPVLSVLPPKSIVEVSTLFACVPDGSLCLAEVPGWALVRAGELAGWVDRRFLTADGGDG